MKINDKVKTTVMDYPNVQGTIVNIKEDGDYVIHIPVNYSTTVDHIEVTRSPNEVEPVLNTLPEIEKYKARKARRNK